MLQHIAHSITSNHPDVVVIVLLIDERPEEVTEMVNAYLRQLKAQAAILGGRCWADPDLNTAQAIADGRVYFDFDFTAPYPAEHIVFRSHLVGDYLEEIL